MTKIIRREISQSNQFQNIPDLLQRIYSNRGLTSSDELEKGLDRLPKFNELKGIDKAVACIFSVIEKQQNIIIVGDFDADGATSTSLVVSALRMLGAKHVDFLVPNRFEYGYGLTPEIVDVAKQKNPQLIITVDNGISSCDGVKRAKELGIKVVVTDHHLPGHELPKADAIVNPNQPGDTFPTKNLAGVGVIFYVMLALRRYLAERDWFKSNNIPEPNMGSLLDLVALGTVADVVPLDHINRILVHQGLQRIRNGKARPGLQALIEIAKRKPEKLYSSDLGFAIGPRLNAAGRLDDMSYGINCLLAEDKNVALKMAQRLDDLNQERKSIEASMKLEAFAIFDKLPLHEMPFGVALYQHDWHQGVIGILASRVKDHLHRPVIAFAKVSDTEIKGSARSIPGLHIRDALDTIATQNPGLISKFGGHAMAAGLSMPPENFEKFQTAFADYVKEQLTEDALQGVLYSDGELLEDEFEVDTAELLQEAGPWGQAFPEPMFDNKFKIIQQRIIADKHLKLSLEIPSSRQLIQAISFNVDLDEWPNHRCEYVHAVFRLDVNEYRGFKSSQLIIEHLSPEGSLVE